MASPTNDDAQRPTCRGRGGDCRAGVPINNPGHTWEELQFLRAMDRLKRTCRHRYFPTWLEVLGAVKALGYRQVSPPDPPQPPREAA